MQAPLSTLIDPQTRGIVSLEINPPHGTDVQASLDKLLPHIKSLDFLNITDCALAKLKLAALPFAAYLKQKTNIEVLVNVACRDRNLVAMQADLLAASAFGVDSIVALTGDALSAGDFPDGKAVFEMNSIGLLQMVQKLNSGADTSGKELKGKTKFICGGVVNPNARNLEVELKRAVRKRDAGAQYFLSQPVFDRELALHFLTQFSSIVSVPCLLGLAPLKTARALEGIQKVPGIKVSEEFTNGILSSKDPAEYSKQFCLDVFALVRPLCTGIHVIAGGYPTLAMEVADLLAKSRT